MIPNLKQDNFRFLLPPKQQKIWVPEIIVPDKRGIIKDVADTPTVKPTLISVFSEYAYNDLCRKRRQRDEQSIRYAINQGGTYAGKTMSILLGLYGIMSMSKEPLDCRVFGMTMGHLKSGALKDWGKILNTYDKVAYDTWNKTDHIFKVGLCELQFISIDNPNKVLGTKIDIAFVNEANCMIYETFEQIDMRTKYLTYLDYNPASVFWVHTKIKTQPQSIFKRWNYTHNLENVDKEKVAFIESWKDTNPNRYQVYGLGNTGKLEGAVFPNVQTCAVFPSDCENVIYGMDYGFTNDPTAIIKVGWKDGYLYCEEIAYATGLSSTQIVNVFKNKGIKPSDTIVADTSENRTSEDIRRNAGYYVVPVGKKPDIMESIMLVNAYKGIYITANSINWHKEAQSYVYKTENGTAVNKPIDKHNHCWDALRYAIYSIHFYKTPHS
jgi:phage terminase large subunit